MGLFSSSWKYQAFAASTPLMEEGDSPNTFIKVMLEGLSANDTFGNILRYTLTTDMYARSKSMVRYATRDIDPYIRGLPTSGLTTFNIQKEWISSAILREIKIPLIDFFWLKHGIFDAHYVGCKFIHDHYMDIEYFPWPDGCLLDIKNPNFDDGLEHWIPTDFQANTDLRVAELTADGGTLFSDQVGQVTPGEIISLRAVCCRGADDPAQTGSINITFYNSSGSEITTMSASNTTGGPDEWQLLTVIATVPAGAVTAKAWAGGTMAKAGHKRLMEYCIQEHVNQYYPSAGGHFYPWQSHWPDYFDVDLDFGYWADIDPVYDHRIQYTETAVTAADQMYWKVTIDETVAGNEPLYHDYGVNVGTWQDLYTDEYEVWLHHQMPNGLLQQKEITLTIADSNGAGGPDLSTAQVYPFTIRTYWGVREWILVDNFTYTGGLYYNVPDIDRRADDAGKPTGWWVDLYEEHYENYDRGWISTPSGTGGCRSLAGDVTNEALYVINSDTSNVHVEALISFDYSTNTPGGGLVVRVQDYQNFWLVAIKNPEDVDPVFGIYKVVNGVHTLAAGTTLTGMGPFDYPTWSHAEGKWQVRCEGDVITADMGIVQEGTFYPEKPDQSQTIVSVEDSTFNTQTKVGLWAQDENFWWDNFAVSAWPLGGNAGTYQTGRDWDIFVWDDTPDSGSNTGCGEQYSHFYIYRGPNGKTGPPYHASYAFTNSSTPFPSWLHWKMSSYGSDNMLIQFQPISGDTDEIILAEYGQFANAGAWGDWMDPYDFIVYLRAAEGTTSVATFKARFGIAEPGGSFQNRTLIAGTESVWKNITLTAISTGPC